MILSNQTPAALVIVAKPNHSSNWRDNKRALLAISVPSLGAAIGFSALGAWPILPFAGAELLALGAALYYVNWKLEYRHVVTLSESEVCVDKGYYAPKRRWKFDRNESALAISPEQYPSGPPGLVIHSRQQAVSVGEFLGREDALSLMRLLRKELQVRTHSGGTQIDA